MPCWQVHLEARLLADEVPPAGQARQILPAGMGRQGAGVEPQTSGRASDAHNPGTGSGSGGGGGGGNRARRQAHTRGVEVVVGRAVEHAALQRAVGVVDGQVATVADAGAQGASGAGRGRELCKARGCPVGVGWAGLAAGDGITVVCIGAPCMVWMWHPWSAMDGHHTANNSPLAWYTDGLHYMPNAALLLQRQQASLTAVCESQAALERDSRVGDGACGALAAQQGAGVPPAAATQKARHSVQGRRWPS